jgi:ankyrin repeat protein
MVTKRLHVEFLLEKEQGADVNEQCELDHLESNTGLHFASENGHLLHIVDRLIKCGATINKRPWFGETPLHLAARNGHLSVVDRLIDLGLSVNEANRRGWTPLHSACQNGHLDIIVNRIVERGGSINEKPDHATLDGHLFTLPRSGRALECLSSIDLLSSLLLSTRETTMERLHYILPPTMVTWLLLIALLSMVRQSMRKPILVRPLFTLPLNKAI